MLASLRTLVTKAWDSNHEVAWTWLWELWESVKGDAQEHDGKAGGAGKDLEKLYGSLDDKTRFKM